MTTFSKNDEGGLFPLNRFYQLSTLDSARLGSELGSLRLRIVVRPDSGLVSRLETRVLGLTLLEARLGLLKARFSSRLGLSQPRDRLSGAWLDSLFGARLISARGLDLPWESTRDSESAQCSARSKLGARLRLNSGPAQGSAGDWLGARDSGFDLAWLMDQPGSLGSAWCLGSGRARFGLEAQPDSKLRARLVEDLQRICEDISSHL